MAEEDHLDRDVSVFGEITPTGVKGGARSRAISSLDRLIGSAIDVISVPLEGVAKRGRARQAAQTKLIDALGDQQVKRLHDDSAFAERMLEQQMKVSIRREGNKVETVKLAIEDLRSSPPTDEQNASGPDSLDADFLNRYERYAEDASTQLVRERWARVLASEIRAPGTFSAKVMRIVDELDSATAGTFERVCRHRLGNTLVGCLVGELDFMEQKRLVTGGLIVEPGFGGQIRRATEVTLNSGRKVNMIGMEAAVLALPADIKIKARTGPSLQQSLTEHDGKPAVPVYVLTDEGHAVSSIMEHDERDCFDRFAARLVSDFPDIEIMEYGDNGAGGLSLIKHLNHPQVKGD